MKPSENKMRNTIVCFGEILWDLLPQGKKLGGAPFNVAAHFALLGNGSYILSSIGKDELGEEILSVLKEYPVNCGLLQTSQNRPTSTVEVSLDNSGKPSYTIKEHVAWDEIQSSPEIIETISKASALVFGTLALREDKNRSTLEQMAKHAKLRVLDLNLRCSYFSKDFIMKMISNCDVLKLNDEELETIAQYFQKTTSETIEAILEDAAGPHLIVLTKGEDGADAYIKGESFYAPGIKVEVVDTVGSGDAFLAGFLDHYLNGFSIDACLEKGCRLGAEVASKAGAIPLEQYF